MLTARSLGHEIPTRCVFFYWVSVMQGAEDRDELTLIEEQEFM